MFGVVIVVRNGFSGKGGCVLWDYVVVYVEVRVDIIGVNFKSLMLVIFLEVIGCVFFYGFLMFILRFLVKKLLVYYNVDIVYILFVNLRNGGVVRFKGDVLKLEINIDKVYECVVEWIKE